MKVGDWDLRYTPEEVLNASEEEVGFLFDKDVLLPHEGKQIVWEAETLTDIEDFPLLTASFPEDEIKYEARSIFANSLDCSKNLIPVSSIQLTHKTFTAVDGNNVVTAGTCKVAAAIALQDSIPKVKLDMDVTISDGNLYFGEDICLNNSLTIKADRTVVNLKTAKGVPTDPDFPAKDTNHFIPAGEDTRKERTDKRKADVEKRESIRSDIRNKNSKYYRIENPFPFLSLTGESLFKAASYINIYLADNIKQPPAGFYKCLNCDNTVKVIQSSSLSKCEVCNNTRFLQANITLDETTLTTNIFNYLKEVMALFIKRIASSYIAEDQVEFILDSSGIESIAEDIARHIISSEDYFIEESVLIGEGAAVSSLILQVYTNTINTIKEITPSSSADVVMQEVFNIAETEKVEVAEEICMSLQELLDNISDYNHI